VFTRTTAQRLGVTPVTYTLSAGVGRVGLRGLQLARIDSLELGSLKLRNIPCLIKNPPLRDIPVKETEGLWIVENIFNAGYEVQRHRRELGQHAIGIAMSPRGTKPPERVIPGPDDQTARVENPGRFLQERREVIRPPRLSQFRTEVGEGKQIADRHV